MDILILLIPVSLVFLALVVWLFIWSVNNKQFDDLEKHGMDILFDDSSENERR
jgi:cbb3-type cytochrome oxidase maturation protein